MEILLDQEKKEKCKEFIIENIENVHISDFSLFSIAIVLFRAKAFEDYTKFLKTVTESFQIKTLPTEAHSLIVETSESIHLDFDDSYQHSIAKFYGLKIVTMDKDFIKAKDIKVLFL